MIRSMTGFGTVERADNGVSYAVEVRSGNHRYLKVSLKLPDRLQFSENAVERAVREQLSRGSVSVTIRVQGGSDSLVSPIDSAVLQRYVDDLSRATPPDGVVRVSRIKSIAPRTPYCLNNRASSLENRARVLNRCARRMR